VARWLPTAEPCDLCRESSVSTREESVCEVCGEPLDDTKSTVVIMTSQGQEFVRHERCYMLDLLEQA
jgi:hypothetical protein